MTVIEKPRLLIVDDDHEWGESLAAGLAVRGFSATVADGVTTALAAYDEKSPDREPFDALVTDLRLQDGDGLTLLEKIRERDATLPVLVMTAYGGVDTAVEAIRRGAYHYVTKPFRLDELVIFVRRAIDESRLRAETGQLRRALSNRPPEGLIGHSPAMRNVFDVINRVADTDVPILITGETGTGKSTLAHAIHQRSNRTAAPFVAVNCAAIPESLLESELFGHVKGAFTGAVQGAPGLFAEADTGTVFLDEIGELAIGLQAKLLHVLERGVVRPVGGTKERPVRARIIAATNRNLRAAVEAGSFREDLFYRINLIAIEAPPLSSRREDIPFLIDKFFNDARARYPSSPVTTISPEAQQALVQYRWPGNVRELGHTIERLVLLGRAATVQRADLPEGLVERDQPQPYETESVVPLREVQRRYAAWALKKCGGVKAHAADRLDIDIKTFNRLLDGS